MLKSGLLLLLNELMSSFGLVESNSLKLFFLLANDEDDGNEGEIDGDELAELFDDDDDEDDEEEEEDSESTNDDDTELPVESSCFLVAEVSVRVVVSDGCLTVVVDFVPLLFDSGWVDLVGLDEKRDVSFSMQDMDLSAHQCSKSNGTKSFRCEHDFVSSSTYFTGPFSLPISREYISQTFLLMITFLI